MATPIASTKAFDRGQMPAPTSPPHLLVRSGFNKVCGYENGNPQLPLGCLPGYDCTHDGAASVSGCCATAAIAGKCALETTCIGYSDALATSVARAHSCDGAQPFCTTAYFVDNYAMFTCGNGEKQEQVSAFYHMSSSGAVESGSSRQAQSAGSSGVASSSGSGNDSTGSDGTSSSSSTPIGAIVGGVVAGVAVILLAVFLVWFVLRKKRKDRLTIAGTSAGGSGAPFPADAPGQTGQVYEKRGLGYSELAAPPAEMPDRGMRYAHEAPFRPSDPASVGRSELPSNRDSRYEMLS